MQGIKTLNLTNETVAGSQGAVFCEIGSRRYVMANLTKFKAKFKVNITKKGVLGKSGKQAKPGGWEGSWEATVYYNQSTMRALAEEYKNTGVLPPFNIQTINEDQSSVKTIGRQSVIFKDCISEEMIISMLDVDAEILEEDLSGTFNDFDFPEKFKDLPSA
ncbi:phage tail tube protein [Peptostreptococcus equinus]|uniref:Phage tail tube protein n=1 Tax=Peptostreptococcus equinus TaxID=3003601 RepID=A0ABY7JRI8_9FIRM|nr:phage tail tube protein [Peptostreptococcus sp. CBA3647]WAW15456.1 phage tail tube protein [Peptostreptococcus sp. CBA3647]